MGLLKHRKAILTEGGEKVTNILTEKSTVRKHHLTPVNSGTHAASTMSGMSIGSSGGSGDRMSLEEHFSMPSDHTVDRYKLGRTLGKGHFATVKLARNIDTAEYCALKVR